MKTQPVTAQSFLSRITSALDSLNACYGVGSVRSVSLSAAGEGRFEQSPYGMRSRSRRFRILQKGERVTVFALGHQKTA